MQPKSKSVRTELSRLVLTCFIMGSLPGCRVHKEVSLRFRGNTELGTPFLILHTFHWMGRSRDLPLRDSLRLTWYEPPEKQDTFQPTPTRPSGSGILVHKGAQQLEGFNVRTDSDRIWLVDSQRLYTIASADLAARTFFPPSISQPDWAFPTRGMIVKNLESPDVVVEFRPFPAPDFSLRQVDGNLLDIASLRGKVVVLNFFGVRCPPCEVEAPHLSALYSKYRNRGLVVIGVNAWNDWKPAIRGFARRHRLAFPVLIGGKQVAKAYGVNGVPATFWIDREGRVVDRLVGFDEAQRDALDEKTRLVLSNP